MLKIGLLDDCGGYSLQALFGSLGMVGGQVCTHCSDRYDSLRHELWVVLKLHLHWYFQGRGQG